MSIRCYGGPNHGRVFTRITDLQHGARFCINVPNLNDLVPELASEPTDEVSIGQEWYTVVQIRWHSKVAPTPPQMFAFHDSLGFGKDTTLEEMFVWFLEFWVVHSAEGENL